MKFRFPIVIIDEDYRSENSSGLGIRALAKAMEDEGMEVLGVTSYGDLSQFAQQQSRASAFVLSIDDEEFGSGTREEIDQALQGVLAQIAPLNGASARELHRFVSACAALMEGGLPAACDWAILLWVLPAMERSARTVAAMRPLLEEYPLSLARLQA